MPGVNYYGVRPSFGRPAEKPEKKPKLRDSARAKRDELASLKSEAQDLEDYVASAGYEDFHSTKDRRLALARRRQRLGRLKEQIRELEYAALTPEERRQLLEDYARLRRQLQSLPMDEEHRADGLRLRRELLDVSQRLSAAALQAADRRAADAWYHQASRGGFHGEEFMRNFERTAAACVEIGLGQLAKELSRILGEQGRLPTAVVFPETSSRPLAHAVKPLLDAVYAHVGQPLPTIQFVKTYSHFGYPERLRKEIEELRARRWQALAERRQLLGELKRTRDVDAREDLSRRAHGLYAEAAELSVRLLAKEKESAADPWTEETAVPPERLSLLAPLLSAGPVLVVDDVVSGGGTLGQLARAFKDMGPGDKAYFFVFVSRSEPPLAETGIRPDRFSAGVVLGDDDLKVEDIGFGCGRTVSDKDGEEWGELFCLGFPYRLDKETATGVVKDQDDLEPFVRRAPGKAASALKVARRYRALGQSIVAKLPLADMFEARNPFD